MTLEVDCAARTIAIGAAMFRCEIGREGVVSARDKREGDGRTPLGTWPVRGVLLRPDRGFSPPPAMPWRWMRATDGWCDDVQAPEYNRSIDLPTRWSAEMMWREDGVYDVVVVLGHNDDPPVPGAGSAIFLHLAGPGATAGCIGIDAEPMRLLLANIALGMHLTIR